MSPAERKAALKEKGVTQLEIARRTGFKPPFINEIVHNTRRNARVQRAIARAIGRPLAEVFPSVETVSA